MYPQTLNILPLYPTKSDIYSSFSEAKVYILCMFDQIYTWKNTDIKMSAKNAIRFIFSRCAFSKFIRNVGKW